MSKHRFDNWGERVKLRLANLDVKAFGRVGVLMGGRSGEQLKRLYEGGTQQNKQLNNELIERGLMPGSGPKLLWTFRDAGDGYSGPVVVGDQLFMIGVQKDTETIFSLDTKTGKPIWSTGIGKPYPNKWGGGPRSTPTFDSGKVYGISGK